MAHNNEQDISVTTLHEAVSLSSDERGLVVVSTLRATGTIQSSLVNAGVLTHPATGETIVAVVAVGPVKLANLRARPQVTSTNNRPRVVWKSGAAPRRRTDPR